MVIAEACLAFVSHALERISSRQIDRSASPFLCLPKLRESLHSLSRRRFVDKHRRGAVPATSEKLLFRREVVWGHRVWEKQVERQAHQQVSNIHANEQRKAYSSNSSSNFVVVRQLRAVLVTPSFVSK